MLRRMKVIVIAIAISVVAAIAFIESEIGWSSSMSCVTVLIWVPFTQYADIIIMVNDEIPDSESAK